ncbi:tetratricopeptide repeat protein [uncultured Devosia sp.]|uniref:tetratricopeptide repeat protein n=1 Tax=uncultured Devosia sp. TaxID=211434 RepID=UPI0035CC5494
MSFPLSRLLPLMLLLGLVASTAPTQAQAIAAVPATNAAPVVDETALRYFARQGDERRLRAEIARLSAIYPGWVPPDDPLSSDTAVDPLVQQIWDLYGKGDLAGAQALIAARTTTEPGWRPPAELADALVGAEAADGLRRAITAGDNADVVALAATHPELLTCQNIDLLWGVGEAFAETRREPRALDAFSYVLENCDNDRLATMQKAEVLFDETTLSKLLALERIAPDGTGEFAAIEIDLARRRVADVLNGVVTRADPAALAMVAATAKTDMVPDDLRLLGYYELKGNRDRQARDWFEQAYAADSSAASAEGLAIAMLRLGDGIGAEALLANFRTETPELETQYLAAASAVLAGDPPRQVDATVLQRIIEAVTDTRDARVAQDLGWYAYGFEQTQTAVQWFEQSLGYEPTFEPAAYGLVVASQKLRDRQRVRELIEKWGPVSPRIRLFGRPNAPTTAPARFNYGLPGATLQNAMFRFQPDAPPAFMLVAELTQQQRQAMARCGSFLPPESLSPNTALPRAWCLMDLGRDAEAESTFRQATTSPSVSVRTDAYYGQTLALLRLGLIDDAAVSASAMPQTPERVRDLQVAILTNSATTYYAMGRYDEVLQLLDQRATLSPEQNDLLTIRAWSYFHLSRLREAKQIFAAVAATGYPDAQRGLEATTAAMRKY